MHKKQWLSTSVLLVVFIAELTCSALAQTRGRPLHVNEQHRLMTSPLWEAKAAAARAARSNANLTLPRFQAEGAFLTFDAPGASASTNLGTFPAAVSTSGVITGFYKDVNSLSHGFVREVNGAFVTFDVPGAVNGTFPAGVNNEGAVTGAYADSVGSGLHSFVRFRNGRISTFDPPGAPVANEGTAINASGTVSGFYFDLDTFAQHAFLRTRDGRIVTADPPDVANAGPFDGALPVGITADGLTLGVYTDANSITYGYLRTKFGQVVKITGPGGLGDQYDIYASSLTPFVTYSPSLVFYSALSINPSGVIAGTYFQPLSNAFGGVYRVFLRSPNGTYVTFDAASYPPCCIFSAPSGINAAGTVTGSFNDGFDIDHGFWRTRDGTVTPFDVPGAGTAHYQNTGTLPIGITERGIIAGSYRDANNVTRGFLFKPKCRRELAAYDDDC